MNESLKEKLRYLHLNRLAAHWDEYLKVAAASACPTPPCSPMSSRRNTASNATTPANTVSNGRASRSPGPSRPIPLPASPSSTKRDHGPLRLAGLHPQSQNIIWLGRTGCGKTGLATSFLIHAIDQGYSGRYVLFAELITELYRSVADHSEAKVSQEVPRLRLSCRSTRLGYVEVEPVQVGLFFTLMQRRHKKKPTLITSNLGFGEWGSFLKNDHLTAALIDRLTENSHVFNMKDCVSLRDKLSAEP